MSRLDLTGQVFSRWTVLGKGQTVGSGRKSKGTWKCLCECGTVRDVATCNLTAEKSRSCGCLQKDWIRETGPAKKRGMCNTAEWGLYRGAYTRAKERGLEFDLKVTDLVVPAHCPLLGIPIIRGTGNAHDNSPSLDRIDNTKGYTKDNVWIISKRANTIKSVATYEELEMIASNLKERILNVN